MKAWENPKGGLSQAGRAHYNASGGHLKPGVTSFASASEADKKRWVRWALRFAKTPQPLTDGKGPSRYALMFHAWGAPVPKSNSDVSRVYQMALKRRAQLGMGK